MSMKEDTLLPKAKKTKRTNAFRRRRPAPTPDGERHEVDLDPKTPKIRAEEELAARRRGFNMAIGLVVVMVLAALGYAAVKETVWANPAFSLRHVYVHTAGMLTPTDLGGATGLTEGVNLLTADLGAVRARLMALPAVRGASVQRDFSGRMDVTVQQRMPVAWVRCENLGWIPKKGGSGLLVDEEGVAIPCINMLSDYTSLPEIQDETLAQVLPGAPLKGEKFEAALHLLKKLRERQGVGGDTLQSVRVKNDCALEATLASGIKATFAWDDVDNELARYDLVTAEARRRKWTLETVNLMAEHNVPVTFKATAQPGGVAKAVQIAQPSHRSQGSSNSSRRRTQR